jgi:hypothetical protein
MMMTGLIGLTGWMQVEIKYNDRTFYIGFALWLVAICSGMFALVAYQKRLTDPAKCVYCGIAAREDIVASPSPAGQLVCSRCGAAIPGGAWAPPHHIGLFRIVGLLCYAVLILVALLGLGGAVRKWTFDTAPGQDRIGQVMFVIYLGLLAFGSG